MGYKERFESKLNKYGQTITLNTVLAGELCPGYDPITGYCDPQYHRENPSTQQCNADGRINANELQLQIKAFVYPAKTLLEEQNEFKNLLIGRFGVDDTIFIADVHTDYVNLSEEHRFDFEGKKYKLEKPDLYKVADTPILTLGRLVEVKDV